MKESLIQTVVIEAIKFSRFLRRQRPAWFVVDPNNFGFQFIGDKRCQLGYNPLYMEDGDLDDDEDTTKLLVRMLTSPALVKRGNFEGEDYGNRDCVVKATVVTA